MFASILRSLTKKYVLPAFLSSLALFFTLTVAPVWAEPAAVIATVPVVRFPIAVAVNPGTNKIYVVNHSSSGIVTVIDGVTHSTATVAVGSYPGAVALNPATNQIYVAHVYSDYITVVDGATNSTTTVATGIYPQAIAVNPITNKIYVANYGS